VGWYGSAYLLTEMSFQPIFGRFYTFFDKRLTYLASILICEFDVREPVSYTDVIEVVVGSIVCSTAPTSVALIIGRSISGMGAAGLLCGALSMFARTVPVKKRPIRIAIMTSMYGIAGVIAPTLGGVITDTPRLTWRFCFWYVAARIIYNLIANQSRMNLRRSRETNYLSANVSNY